MLGLRFYKILVCVGIYGFYFEVSAHWGALWSWIFVYLHILCVEFRGSTPGLPSTNSSNSVPPLIFNTMLTAHGHLLYPQVWRLAFYIQAFNSVFYIRRIPFVKIMPAVICNNLTQGSLCCISVFSATPAFRASSANLCAPCPVAVTQAQSHTSGSTLSTSQTASLLRLQWDWQELNLCIILFQEGAYWKSSWEEEKRLRCQRARTRRPR